VRNVEDMQYLILMVKVKKMMKIKNVFVVIFKTGLIEELTK